MYYCTMQHQSWSHWYSKPHLATPFGDGCQRCYLNLSNFTPCLPRRRIVRGTSAEQQLLSTRDAFRHSIECIVDSCIDWNRSTSAPSDNCDTDDWRTQLKHLLCKHAVVSELFLLSRVTVEMPFLNKQVGYHDIFKFIFGLWIVSGSIRYTSLVCLYCY